MNILFFGRKNDIFSIKLYKILKSLDKNCKVIWSDGIRNIFNKNIKYFDYIICFRSSLILKKKHISKAKHACINFHPGTPVYRGIGCANLAIINKAKLYGSTAHMIDEKIDHGDILDVRLFKLKPNYNIEKLLTKTHKTMFFQAKKLLMGILKKKYSLDKLILTNKKYKWSKNLMTKKKLEKLYFLKLPTTKKKLERYIKALDYKNFHTYFKIKNKKFFLSARGKI